MTCENKVTFYVAQGRDYGQGGTDYRATEVPCGNTDPWGDRAICGSCANNKSKMAEIKIQDNNTAADNAWLRSAGQGEM